MVDGYRIVRLLGRGATGDVYLAWDEGLERYVAMKFVRNVEHNPRARRRIIAEGRVAARILDPNVLFIFRVGDLDGRPYLVTEYIDGEGLDKLPVPLHWRRALEFGIDLSRGLAAVHRRGIVHRDISRKNAVRTRNGNVKLVDFGLAKPLSSSGPPSSSFQRTSPYEPGSGLSPISRNATISSESGAMVGTPDYRAPEVWSGEPATERSDVYALGAVLFELCAGHPPHAHVPAHRLSYVVQTQDAPALVDLAPEVSLGFSEIVCRCLRRDPSQRFSTGDELRETLERFKSAHDQGSDGAARVAVPPRGAARPRAQTTPIPHGNPYCGMCAFEAEHRAFFFGRRDEIATLTRRMKDEPLVIVTGGSGIGKSSLCRAGVLPAVEDGAFEDGRSWQAATVIPGPSPVQALAAALAAALDTDKDALERDLLADPGAIASVIEERLGDDRGLVLLVDPLEDLFTVSDAESRAVVDEVLYLLTRGIPGVRVLMTVRSDFLDRAGARLPRLGDHTTRAPFFLRPLSRDAIREAICEPARLAGFPIESALQVEAMVQGASLSEWGLPLLQFALAKLWEARDTERRVIAVDAFEKIGSCANAIAQHADDVLEQMKARERAAARRILTMLVGPRGAPIPRLEDDLVAGDPHASAALRHLVRGRLLVAQDASLGVTYALVHEVLLDEWKTLQRWLQDESRLLGRRSSRRRKPGKGRQTALRRAR